MGKFAMNKSMYQILGVVILQSENEIHIHLSTGNLCVATANFILSENYTNKKVTANVFNDLNNKVVLTSIREVKSASFQRQEMRRLAGTLPFSISEMLAEELF